MNLGEVRQTELSEDFKREIVNIKEDIKTRKKEPVRNEEYNNRNEEYT